MLFCARAASFFATLRAMSPRLRIAASVLALLAAWWLGMLAERSRTGAREHEASADEARRQSAAADGIIARREAARAAEMQAAREHAATFTDPAPPRDLAARFEAARRTPIGVQQIRRLTIATADLSAGEIPAALDFASHFGGDSQEKLILRFAILARWAELDPPAAAAYAVQQPKSGQNNYYARPIETVIGEWAMRDPAGAADFVAKLDAERRSDAVSALLAGVATTQPEKALALLARFPDEAGIATSEAIFGAWGDLDPQRVVARALALPPGEFRSGALYGLTTHWTRSNPVSTYAWAAQLSDPAERAAALQHTLHVWGEIDPPAAANHAVTLTDPEILNSVAEEITSQLAPNDLPAARRFADGIATELARSAAQTVVAQYLSEKSFNDAIAYAGEIPEGKARERALYSISASWSSKDPVATAQWLGMLPPSGSRDAAVAAYAERTAELDGEAALAWAASIGAEKSRTESTTKAYEAWQKKAPQAAQAWLDANRTLPDDLRAALTPQK